MSASSRLTKSQRAAIVFSILCGLGVTVGTFYSKTRHATEEGRSVLRLCEFNARFDEDYLANPRNTDAYTRDRTKDDWRRNQSCPEHQARAHNRVIAHAAVTAAEWGVFSMVVTWLFMIVALGARRWILAGR